MTTPDPSNPLYASRRLLNYVSLTYLTSSGLPVHVGDVGYHVDETEVTYDDVDRIDYYKVVLNEVLKGISC